MPFALLTHEMCLETKLRELGLVHVSGEEELDFVPPLIPELHTQSQQRVQMTCRVHWMHCYLHSCFFSSLLFSVNTRICFLVSICCDDDDDVMRIMRADANESEASHPLFYRGFLRCSSRSRTIPWVAIGRNLRLSSPLLSSRAVEKSRPRPPVITREI